MIRNCQISSDLGKDIDSLENNRDFAMRKRSKEERVKTVFILGNLSKIVCFCGFRTILFNLPQEANTKERAKCSSVANS